MRARFLLSVFGVRACGCEMSQCLLAEDDLALPQSEQDEI